MVLPSAQAVALPAGVPGEVGACLGIPALTALHAVLTGERGVAGQRVLVAGGAGAVGHYAVQFARRLGAAQVVATVSSAAKAALAREAGADATIDYKTEDLAARGAALTGGAGFDRIVEVDAAVNLATDLGLLRPGGDLVIYGSGGDFSVPFFPAIARNATLRCFIVYNLGAADRARAEAVLGAMLARGELQHNIAERLPLAECARAHQLVESGRVAGNVVLRID